MAQYGGISKYDEPVDEADMRDENDMSDEEFQNDTFFEGNSFAGIRSAGDVKRLEAEIERLKRELASYSNVYDMHYRQMELELETRQKKLWQHNLDRARANANRRLEDVRHLCRVVEPVNDVENADPTDFGDLMHEIDEFLLARQRWYDANTAHAT